MDIFHLNRINKKALSLNKEIVIITQLCEKYAQNPSEKNAIKMIESIVKVNQDLDTIKLDVADLVNKVDKDVISISKEQNGYVIKD